MEQLAIEVHKVVGVSFEGRQEAIATLREGERSRGGDGVQAGRPAGRETRKASSGRRPNAPSPLRALGPVQGKLWR